MHVEPDGEEEKAGVKRARNGGLLVERGPERSSGSSVGEGGRGLERSISGGSLLTLVAGRLSREVALRFTGLGVARGVKMTSRGGVGRVERGVLRGCLPSSSSPSTGVADARGRDERIWSISKATTIQPRGGSSHHVIDVHGHFN